MFHNIRTFGRDRLSFADALEVQAMMREATKAALAQRWPKVTDAFKCPHLVELWEGLLGVPDLSACQTVIPHAVDSTIPPEYLTVVRGLAGTCTAFAYCELAKAIATVHDLEDDFEVRKAMVEGWRRFEERRQQANAVQEGTGCDDSQSWLTLRDITDESNDPTLLQRLIAIMQLAGRMYDHFGYQRRDVKNEDPEEVKGAKQGGDIDRVLPTELALLSDEDTQDLQAMKVLMRQAPVLEQEGKESRTRGPLVLVVDESGSMSDFHGYNSGGRYKGRNTWAKACAVALIRVAWQENRPVKAVHFGTSTETQDIPKDDYRALFEFMRSFLSGGTQFGPAIKRGRGLVGDLDKAGFKGADIVLVTDGEDYDHAAHNAQIDEMDKDGIKLWTVAVGEDIDAKNPVRARAERYVYASDQQLGNANTAVQLAHGLDAAAMDDKDWSVN